MVHFSEQKKNLNHCDLLILCKKWRISNFWMWVWWVIFVPFPEKVVCTIMCVWQTDTQADKYKESVILITVFGLWCRSCASQLVSWWSWHLCQPKRHKKHLLDDVFCSNHIQQFQCKYKNEKDNLVVTYFQFDARPNQDPDVQLSISATATE